MFRLTMLNLTYFPTLVAPEIVLRSSSVVWELSIWLYTSENSVSFDNNTRSSNCFDLPLATGHAIPPTGCSALVILAPPPTTRFKSDPESNLGAGEAAVRDNRPCKLKVILALLCSHIVPQFVSAKIPTRPVVALNCNN